MNTLKIYDIVVPLTDELTGVGAISLVEHPAVEIGFLKFNNDTAPIQLQFNEDKHIITGVAMLADTPIYRNNEHYGEHYVVFSKQTIRNIVEKYAKFGYQNIVNIEHSADRFVNDVYMIESYLIDKERGIVPNEFKDVPDGSWIVSYKINNLSVWDEIKAGNVLGFSIEGLFSYGTSREMPDSRYGDEVNVDKHSEEQKETFDEWLERIIDEIENK